MIDRRASPGLVAGSVGVAASVVAVVTDQVAWAVPAGVGALVAGGWCLVVIRMLDQARADAAALVRRTAALETESNRLANRASQYEADMIKTRAQLADAMREEAAQATPSGTPSGGSTASGRHADPVTDAATGFFNEWFFMATLEKRVSAARRGLRPLAVALIEVVNGVTGSDDDQPRPSDPLFIAAALVETFREADTVARLQDGRYALLLEDTPENGAIWTLERFRRRIIDTQAGHTVWAGLSSYPAHAFDAGDLMAQAHVAIASAKEWRQDRIEVALTPDD